MKKYKKVLIDAILFFVIIGLTLYGVFHGEDLSGLKDAIKECNILWLIPAVPLVLFFIAGESIVIWHMLDCSLAASHRQRRVDSRCRFTL